MFYESQQRQKAGRNAPGRVCWNFEEKVREEERRLYVFAKPGCVLRQRGTCEIFGTFGIHPHESQQHKNVDTKFILNATKENNKLFSKLWF